MPVLCHASHTHVIPSLPHPYRSNGQLQEPVFARNEEPSMDAEGVGVGGDQTAGKEEEEKRQQELTQGPVWCGGGESAVLAPRVPARMHSLAC